MSKILPLETRTADEWAMRIEKQETEVSEAEARADDIEAGCRRLQLMAQEGSAQAQKDLERQTADLIAATTDRDGLRNSLVAAREIQGEAAVREVKAVDEANRQEIAALADKRNGQAQKAQKVIDALTKILGEMMETGVQIDRLAKLADVRRHYIGESFASRICQALGPALKPFSILAHIDSSHPRFGEPLTKSEGTGEDALNLLARGRREAQKLEERRAATKARYEGAA
jgi:hypothetical protein